MKFETFVLKKEFFFQMLIIINICFIIFGLGSLLKNYFFIQKAVKTTGEVVEVVQITDNFIMRKVNRYRLRYSPKITFKIQSGENVTFIANNKTINSSLFSKGMSLSIAYEKNNPSNAKINEFNELYAGKIVYIIMSFIIFLFSVIKVFLIKKKQLRE
ncbi:MAG: DUF3592 domain-containing protein [Candidatus Magasanikbacteria bacterium]|jgi:hypothetical protein|nr:DUF3592 domain-containing protein [Candidatus Magasanikbacteria bacterium]MBT4071579.1 DUF3592 domain-containing protein [Candidatus Magasanikbacteria bacterium]